MTTDVEEGDLKFESHHAKSETLERIIEEHERAVAAITDGDSADARRARKEATHLTADAYAVIEYWRRQHVDPMFIYFAAERSEEGSPQGLIKIGLAADPLKRIQGLQCGNSQCIVAFEVVLATKPLERDLHRYYRHMRRHGEWFAPLKEGSLIGRAHNAAVLQVEEHRLRRCRLAYLRGELVAPVLMPDGPW